MSFEDTVQTFRDIAEIEQAERKQRLADRQAEIEAAEKIGYNVQRFNGGVHVRISFLDYWPSTGRWNNPIKKRRGQLEDGESLADLVRREVGDPWPGRRKSA